MSGDLQIRTDEWWFRMLRRMQIGAYHGGKDARHRADSGPRKQERLPFRVRLDVTVNDGIANSSRTISPDLVPVDTGVPSARPTRHFLYGHPLMVKLIDPPTRA